MKHSFSITFMSCILEFHHQRSLVTKDPAIVVYTVFTVSYVVIDETIIDKGAALNYNPSDPVDEGQLFSV